MGILRRAKPRLRKGLSAATVRLITGEPEPIVPSRRSKKVSVPDDQYFLAAKKQLTRLLEKKVRRKARRRG